MGITRIAEVRTCPHRTMASVLYVHNEVGHAPVIMVDGLGNSSCVISLTNQVIRVACPSCFADLRSELRKLKGEDVGVVGRRHP